MNKRAYIFCLLALIIVATFEIGYNIGKRKENNTNNSQANAEVSSKEDGYWIQSVDGMITVFENDKETVVATTEIYLSIFSKEEQEVLKHGFYFDNAEELFNFLEANTS